MTALEYLNSEDTPNSDKPASAMDYLNAEEPPKAIPTWRGVAAADMLKGPSLYQDLSQGVSKASAALDEGARKVYNQFGRGANQVLKDSGSTNQIPELKPGESVIPDSVLEAGKKYLAQSEDAVTRSGKSNPESVDAEMQALTKMGATPDPENIKSGLPNTPFAEGSSSAAKNAVKGITTPGGLATLPLFEFKAGRAALLGVQALQTPGQLKKTYDVLSDEKSTPSQKWEALGDAGMNLAMTGALGLGVTAEAFKAAHTPEEAAKIITDKDLKVPDVVQPPKEVIPATESQDAAAAVEETPKNLGGSQEDLPPEVQAESKANNAPTAGWGDTAQALMKQLADKKAAETAKVEEPSPVEEPETPAEPIVDQPVNKTEDQKYLVGVGGAVPSEFEKPGSFVSNMFAAIDNDRESMGKPPMPETKSRTWDQDNSKALTKMNSEPNWIPDLIQQVKKSPRPLLSWENAGMVWQRAKWKAESGNALARISQAFDEGRTDDLQQAQIENAVLEDHLNELDEAVGRNGTGTEAGRSLQAQKMAAGDDFSLVEMRLKKRAANNGKPLTPDQAKEISELHQKLQENQAAFEKHKVEQADVISKMRAQTELDRIKREAGPSINPKIIEYAKKFVDGVDTRADAARIRFRQKMGRVSSGVDPTILFDLAEIGASKLAHAALDVVKFTHEMISELGESAEQFKPHMQEIFDASQKKLDELLSKQSEPVKQRVKSNATAEDKIGGVKDSISEKVKAGKKNELTYHVQRLARLYIESGISDREKLIDAVHNTLKESIPDISRRETMDAISGYGNFKQLSKDEISTQLRGMKGEMQQLGKLEDMQAGKAPLKSGVERRAPTDEERRLLQQVNDMKRRSGFQSTDPATQLKSALDGVKTRLSNQIKDLEYQIETKEKIVKHKHPSPSDAEVVKLRKKRDEVKAKFDELFTKPGLTDEQRIKLASDALERSIAEYDRRIKDKDFTEPVSQTPPSAQLDDLRIKRAAAREQFKELLDLDSDYQTKKSAEALQKEKTDLEQSIVEKEAQIKSGKVESNSGQVNRPAEPTLEPLKQQRDALNKQLAEMRKKPEAQRETERIARELKRLNDAISEKEKKIASGDLSAQASKVNRPLPPGLEQAKQRLDALNNQISELRKPKRTPEERALQSYKTRTAKSIEELQDKLNRGDYSKNPRREMKLDETANRLKAKVEQIKQTIRRGFEKDRLANRPKWEKAMEQVAGTARASALSGYHTILKLAGYDLAKMVETPATEVVGGALSKVPGLKPIFEKAHLESGPTLKAIGDFYAGAAIKGMKEAWNTLRRGDSQAKLLYGKPQVRPPQWFDFFGNLHMAEKTPLLTGTHEMYLHRAELNAIRQGLDPQDEFVKATINKEAYDYSQKAILQENNKFAEAVSALHDRLEKANPKTGQVDIANATISTLVKTFLTKGIVRTPANYFSQTIARTPIGLLTGAAKSAMAHYRGIGNLHPIEANAISALIKTGAVGSAFFLLGMIDATKKPEDRTFGGYWEPGRKRDGKDVDWGKIRIGGVTLPHLVTHNPLTESAQMGATMMRVALSKFNKHDKYTQGMASGAVKALVGLEGKAPVASPLMRMGEARSNVAGDLLQGLVPQLLQNIAEDTDTKKRSPKTALDSVKMAIPGLRQEVPKSKNQ